MTVAVSGRQLRVRDDIQLVTLSISEGSQSEAVAAGVE